MAQPFTRLRDTPDADDDGLYTRRPGAFATSGIGAQDVGLELGLARDGGAQAVAHAPPGGGVGFGGGVGAGGAAADAGSRGARIAENLREIGWEATTEGLISRMEAIAEAIAVGGAVGRQLRAAYPRDVFIRVALEKRNDAPHIWTRDTAQAYGRMLRAHVTGMYEGAPSDSGGVGGGPNDSGSEGSGIAGAISQEGMRALLALSERRKHLLMFGIIMGSLVGIIILVSMVAGRKFGPYYLSNLLLCALSAMCIIICSRKYRSRGQEVFFHELYYLCGFVALVTGTVASVIFLGTVTSRVSSVCASYAGKCDGFSETFLNLVGFGTALFMTVLFVAAYAYGLVLSDRYVQLLRIAQLANDGSLMQAEERTLLTPLVLVVATYFMPSGMCMRRHARRVARHSTGALGRCATAMQDPLRRNGPGCGCITRTCEAVSTSDCGCPTWTRNDRFCLCICVFIIVVPAIACFQTDDRLACFVSTMVELILQILTSN